jgi:hypothetical protein
MSAFSHDEVILNAAREFRNFSIDERRVIKAELESIIRKEKALREHAIKTYGLVNIDTMPDARKNPRRASSKADKDNCICKICNQDCYLSAMSNAKQTQFVCLYHIDKVAFFGEDNSRCKLLIRFKNELLDEILNSIEC